MCKAKGITYLEVSAKTGDNVPKAFEQLAEMLMKIYPKEEQNNEPMAVVEDIRKKRREFQLNSGVKESKKSNRPACCWSYTAI